MRRPLKFVVLSAILLIAVAFVASWFLDSLWRSEVARSNPRNFLNTDPGTLNRELRFSIPLGSSVSYVEQVLNQEGLRFRFDQRAQTILAAAPYVKGSSWLIRSDLDFRFHFDSSSKLVAIDSKEGFTGP
jgi:hypothetical protein